jgi:hypothetical protein
MQICPDCKKAKISQIIPLQERHGSALCPDCGGYLFNDEWYSAPKYPDTDDKWSEILSAPLGGKCRKINGVWRDNHSRKVG